MNIFLFSATKGNKANTLLHNTYNKFCNTAEYEFFIKENNKLSIAVTYNKAIDFAIAEKFNYIVLCHDDVIIESNLIQKLQENFKQYDVIGVAGATHCNFIKPALWHLMGGGVSGGKLHGAVAHGTTNNKQMTSFGEYPKHVVMIDGVFMAIKREVFTQIRFDESCPAKFHFYDLQYSIDASLAGFKVGVSDILITHASPGLKEFTDEFNKGQDWFLEKYKKYNNKTITV